MLAEVPIPKNNTIIANLAFELQWRMATVLTDPRLFNRTEAYFEYRYPISLPFWASMLHYQASEEQLDDLIVDPVSALVHL